MSIALISEDGTSTFYAERDPLPSAPTQFVATTVYPLLQRGSYALTDDALSGALLAFLKDQSSPHVIADYPNDLQLFRQILSWGYDEAASQLEPQPTFPCTLMSRDAITTGHLERWFSKHPELKLCRHHALVDANALRMAWKVATGRLNDDFGDLM
ncbi:hypothetical protein ABE493_08190 [Stenotrophomonas terrae]|uniref:hypothetical protein n=1 Tax=Stenotrophomonas terrae TaxID=405446 RepID=UPI00320AA245